MATKKQFENIAREIIAAIDVREIPNDFARAYYSYVCVALLNHFKGYYFETFKDLLSRVESYPVQGIYQ